jgi:hypothetical protein
MKKALQRTAGRFGIVGEFFSFLWIKLWWMIPMTRVRSSGCCSYSPRDRQSHRSSTHFLSRLAIPSRVSWGRGSLIPWERHRWRRRSESPGGAGLAVTSRGI